jgi:hypothetical protein
MVSENNDLEISEKNKSRENYCLINGKKEENEYTECMVTDSEQPPEKGINFEDAIYLGQGEYARSGKVIELNCSMLNILRHKMQAIPDIDLDIKSENTIKIRDHHTRNNHLEEVAKSSEKLFNNTDEIELPKHNLPKDLSVTPVIKTDILDKKRSVGKKPT